MSAPHDASAGIAAARSSGDRCPDRFAVCRCEAALLLVDQLPLDDYRYFHSTRADLLRRLGRNAEARIAFGRALALTDNESERRFLEGRMLELRPGSDADWDEFWTSTLNDLKETL